MIKTGRGSRFAHILEKKVRENLSRLSFNEFAMVHRGI